jgi:Tfp pilus assembly protein PilV
MTSLKRNRRGQSLIEAIVALGIISTSISSALSLAASSLGAEKESGASITAGNLAREGIEVVRMLRDSNWLAGAAWDVGLTSGTAGSYDYTAAPVLDIAESGVNWSLNFTPNAVTDPTATVYRCTLASCPGIFGLFRQLTTAAPVPLGYSPSGFSRLITMNPICEDGTVVTAAAGCLMGNEKIGLRVTSNVRWTSGGRDHTLAVEERLYDWR